VWTSDVVAHEVAGKSRRPLLGAAVERMSRSPWNFAAAVRCDGQALRTIAASLLVV
jgi:hypothetical protein